MQPWAQALESGRFLITAELNPPKGTDLQGLLEKAEHLKDVVAAVNVTDQTSSLMAMSPTAVSHLLLDQEVEPILQMTCRDRNRIALQADLLGAYSLGIRNVLCMTGDLVDTGDHPRAKPVFDLGVLGLLQGATALMKGVDLAGNQLKGAPSFCLGAVANPRADPTQEAHRIEEKVEAGARFFQTQAVFEPEVLADFMDRVKHLKVPVLAGIIVLKSGDMARKLNRSLPGVHVPEAMVGELDAAEDQAAKGREIAARLIQQAMSLCQGIHLMAMGWEQHIPTILEQAGILKESQV